ncbi:membrane peptidoglycan carboxypeptidase [Lipingzhangella halophila]|uniref:Membrane peptidoglycan carboxypeptidase n=1 Tax=Lipingzhangella halophila TaxID=1783352 RepID=A0A7W7RM25_9ACTN|nr:transglycosylase domain-containing protein [Lipingzhangella halophila]MBB4934464.1 membrane peptidoglycan carboxypeptidase [Lipingzhangella halophila]
MRKPTLMVGGLILIAGVVTFGVLYARTPGVEELNAKAETQLASTSIQYADGSEAVTTGELNRVPVEAGDIPEPVINGVLGSEQRNFYEEPGISVSGTMRAVLTGGQAGGGSTITQQMARNYYGGLSQERSYVRKIKEILISIKVGRSLPPEQILAQYLNTIYFGRDAYGIQAAAQAYFGKDVGELNEAEGAFIGAIIQQPSNFQNVEADSEMAEILQERWEYSVNGMVEMHEDNPDRGISQAEADKLEFPETIDYEAGDNLSGSKGYIKTAVEEELQERYGIAPEEVATSGYRVQTSLDEELMKAAEDAFSETLPDMPEETLMGLTAVDPKTGEIQAFHGGRDFTTEANNSLTHRAQAGSTFKPYVLATGLEQGIGLKSTFDGDSPQEFPGVEEEIQNNENQSYGEVDLIESTASSINTTFMELAVQTTPEAVVETAKASGIEEEQFETAATGPNIALGTYQLTALDQAAGFSTFANNGTHMPQHMVTEVVGSEGEEIEPNDADQLEQGTKAFSPEIAADATHAMTQVVEDGSGDAAALDDGRPVAGKTGISNEAKSAWFVGFTPQLSASVSLSRSDGEQLVIPGVNDVYGGTTSARIWKAFMDNAMEGKEVQEFPEPAWVGDKQNFVPEPSHTSSEESPEEPSEDSAGGSAEEPSSTENSPPPENSGSREEPPPTAGVPDLSDDGEEECLPLEDCS